jgi:hypothetical protein
MVTLDGAVALRFIRTGSVLPAGHVLIREEQRS